MDGRVQPLNFEPAKCNIYLWNDDIPFVVLGTADECEAEKNEARLEDRMARYVMDPEDHDDFEEARFEPDSIAGIVRLRDLPPEPAEDEILRGSASRNSTPGTPPGNEGPSPSPVLGPPAEVRRT